MRTRAGLLIAALIVGAALVAPLARPAESSASALPYYDSRDFTPRWSEVSHRVGPFELIDSFVLDCCRQCGKHFLHILSRQRRCLKKLHTVLLRQLFSFVVGDHAVIVEIAFIATQHNIAVGWCSRLYIPHPTNHVIEGRTIRNIVRQDKAVGSTKEIGCQAPEAFLTCRVPQLETHGSLFNLMTHGING